MAQDSLSLPGLGDADGGAQVTAYGDGGSGKALAVVTLIAMLTSPIIVVAGLGVLNGRPHRSASAPTTSASSRPSA